MIRRRLVYGLSTATFLLVVFALLSIQHATKGLDVPGLVRPKGQNAESCTGVLGALKALDLTPGVQYAKRCITARAVDDYKPRSIVHLEQRLLTGFQDVALDQLCEEQPVIQAEIEDCITIDYPVFKPPHDIGTSALLLGASTTLERLNDSLPQMARWLANKTTSLVVIIKDSGDFPNFEAVQEKADALGIDATLLPNLDPSEEDRHAQRHFNVLHALYINQTPANKWFGIIDDDTFFPSLPALLDALRPYDPNMPYYIGALSEDWHGVAHFGYMAYGGAGMFLSRPLLETLHANFDACKTAGYEGDILYRDCIYSVTSPPVQLTQLPGLHQLDFFGDVSGWYEAGIKPVLSLHHYNGWHNYPVQYGHLITDICGTSCFLQRYRFADDVVLTNGYSLVKYPRGLQNIDFNRVEGTFLHEKGQFDFSLGSFRPALGEKDKVSWRLEYAVKDDGMARQFYVRRAERDEKGKLVDREGRDSVIEVEWRSQ